MNHEEIFKRPSGDYVRVYVFASFHSQTIEYRTQVHVKKKGKRTFWPLNVDSHEYRTLTMEERKRYEYQKQCEVAGEENIQEVKMKLWDKMKPVPPTK